MGNWTQMSEMFGIGTSLLRRISEAEALHQGAVSAAVDVLSQDISKARLRLVRTTSRGVTVMEAREHPLARRLMLDANEHQTWHEANEMIVRQLGLHQNAFLVKIERIQNDPDPDLVPVHRNRVNQQVSAGRFFYDISASSMGEAAILGFTGVRRFTQDQVIHIRGRMHTGEMGLSTLLIGADVLGLNQSILDFQAGLMKSGLRPNAVITTPENLTDDQWARLKTELREMLDSAISKGKPAIFEAGLKYEPISMDAAKTEVHKARQLLRQEVAALWRIPAYKIGAGETEKYDNKAAAEQTYVDDALIPQAIRIEAILAKSMLTDNERLAGIGFMFDRDDLYDRDRQQASDRIVKQFDSGIITRGEACKKLGYGAVDGMLDTYKIPVNSSILHQDGSIEYVAPSAQGKEEPPKEDPKKSLLSSFLPATQRAEAKQPINVTVNMPEQKPAHMNIDVRPQGSKTITMVPKEDGSAEFIVREAA